MLEKKAAAMYPTFIWLIATTTQVLANGGKKVYKHAFIYFH